MRYYVAVKDGKVDGVRSTTTRRYTHVVHRKGGVGWFATFHPSLKQADWAARNTYSPFMQPTVAEVVEVTREYAMGEAFNPKDGVE
jgi:hypothetical protein